MPNKHLDEDDQVILAARVTQRNAQEGARVGDYVVMGDGRLVRISYLWPYHAQVSESGSWYLDIGGHVDFSGSLESGIARSELELAAGSLDGLFWFFHRDEHRAHNAVHVTVPCRVYRRVERSETREN